MKRILSLYEDINHLAARVARSLAWMAPTIGRLTVGVVFFQSGWGQAEQVDWLIERGKSPKGVSNAPSRVLA